MKTTTKLLKKKKMVVVLDTTSVWAAKWSLNGGKDNRRLLKIEGSATLISSRFNGFFRLKMNGEIDFFRKTEKKSFSHDFLKHFLFSS